MLLLAVDYPWVALGIAVTLLVTAGALAVFLIQTIRRGWSRLLGCATAQPAGVPSMRSPPPRN